MSAANSRRPSSGIITIDFLRTYPALRDKSENLLRKAVLKLNEEFIETVSDLNLVTRDSLASKLPALLLDAIKPPHKNIFRDGLPEMGPLSESTRFTSNPSVPSEEEHPAARAIICDFQCLTGLGELPHPATNIWNQVERHSGTLGGYSNETGVNDFVKMVIVDVIEALDIRSKVKIRAEVEVMKNRPDFMLILVNGYPIGTIEGKQPGDKAMCHPNILGEVYDQLTHLRSIFRIDTPFSILTCYEQWRVCWLNDEKSIKVAQMDRLPETTAFDTPVKSAKRPKTEIADAMEDMTLKDNVDSPPLPPTPSRDMSIQRMQRVDEEGADLNFVFNDDGEREFCATEPISWNEPLLPSILASLTKKMCLAKQMAAPAVLRLANETTSAWKKAPPLSDLDFGLCISHRVKNFFFWEDLGRGADGRAFLVSGGTKGAVGVLKFFQGGHALEKAKHEETMWQSVYSHIASVTSGVRVVQVMGLPALLMPWFHRPDRTPSDLDAVGKTLKEDFKAKGFYHGDVAWRNVGVYLLDGEKRAVLFDMQTVRPARDSQADDDWVTFAVESLSNKLA